MLRGDLFSRRSGHVFDVRRRDARERSNRGDGVYGVRDRHLVGLGRHVVHQLRRRHGVERHQRHQCIHVRNMLRRHLFSGRRRHVFDLRRRHRRERRDRRHGMYDVRDGHMVRCGRDVVHELQRGHRVEYDRCHE
jgi:hypothetical protein